MTVYLVTGCSRGLGLELTSQLLLMPQSLVGTVIATARSEPPAALGDIIKNSNGRAKFIKLDVTNSASANEAAVQVDKIYGKVDVLINNAGSIKWMTSGIESMDDLESTFKTNVMSAHIVTSAFLPLLRKGSLKKCFNISTAIGSIAWASKYSMMAVPAYKVSKAALNMLTVQYALSFKEEGFTFVAISPGWLRTDMGGESADLPAEVGAKAVLEVVQNCDKDANGTFIDIKVPGWEKKDGLNQYDGKILPW